MPPSQAEPDPERAQSLHPTLPFSLGRFTLCRELGAGGMATVYLARMRLAAGLERVVALKTIHSHLAKEQTFVDMFLDEAKIASQISHPNVCSVFDFGEVAGTYFLAMEYLPGEPLIDVINAIAAQQDEDLLAAVPFLAARILADACEGLQAAHSLTGPDGKRLEVVHRDVSPQNLVVTYDGSVKVVDFGCAKALERVTQTNTGMMKGKVSYAAPEQLRAEPLDARADVFALGVCLWECLTLRQLFRRDSAVATAMAVLQEPIPRATEGCPWVPEELATIAERALCRDREERYSSARELGRALRGFIARSGVPFEGAEVAEWMGSLFRDAHEQKREMVANVEAMELSRIAAKPAVAAETTRVEKTGSKPRPAIREETAPTEREAPEDDEPVRLPTRTGRYAVAIGIVLALVAGGAYAYLTQGDAIREALGMSEPPVEPPAVLEEAAPDPTPAEVEAARVEEHESAHAQAATAEAGETEVAAQTAPERRPEAAHSSRTPAHAERPAAAEQPAVEAPPAPAPVARGATLDFSQGPVRVVAEGGGWGIVSHEGRELGRTPLDVRLPVGRQRLSVLPFGRGPARTVEVDVEWGARATVRVPIREPSGTESFGNPY